MSFFKINPAVASMNVDLTAYGLAVGDYLSVALVGGFSAAQTGAFAPDIFRNSSIVFNGVIYGVTSPVTLQITTNNPTLQVTTDDRPLQDNSDPNGDYGLELTPISLFTNGADTVDFNNSTIPLTQTQIDAIKKGVNLFSTRGGDDHVILPNASNVNNIAGSGRAFDQALILGSGNDTVDLGDVPAGIVLGAGTDTIKFASSSVSVSFTSSANTLALTGNLAATRTDPVLVHAFQSGNAIDIVGQPNLTVSARLNPASPGKADLYAGSTMISELQFSDLTSNRANAATPGGDQLHSLQAIADGNNGTKIVFDRTNNPMVNPAKNSIDWEWVQRNEAVSGIPELAPYYPKAATPGKSGVTVGFGIDLGSGNLTANDPYYDDDSTVLAALPNSFPTLFGADWQLNANLVLLSQTIGLKGTKAIEKLKPSAGAIPRAQLGVPGNLYSYSVSLTTSQVNKLDSFVEQKLYDEMVAKFESGSVSSWASLSGVAGLQTAIADLYFNGAAYKSLSKATGKYVVTRFWHDIQALDVSTGTVPGMDTAFNRQLGVVVDELQHYAAPLSDLAKRAAKDAGLIGGYIPKRSAPVQTTTSPTTSTSTTSTTPVSFAATQGTEYAVSAATSGLVGVSAAASDLASRAVAKTLLLPGGATIDPSAPGNFTFTEADGAPNFASLTLPGGRQLGGFLVREQAGGVWQSAVSASPLDTLALPGGTTGLNVTLLDDGGNVLTDASNFVFYVTFAGSGSVSGVIQAAAGSSYDVYRFFSTTDGTHFFTADAAERDAVIANRSDLTYEGVGMQAINPRTGDTEAGSVFRFFDTVHGTHFFTASTSERDDIVSTRPDLVFEPNSTFLEHASEQPGDTAVYRFFDSVYGTHFYTTDTTERATIIATRPDLVAEGIGFYTPVTA